MIRILKNIFHLFEAIIATILYGYPAKKLYIIGVTGTDGKTTTVSLIHHILTTYGAKAGIISTIGAKIIDQEIPIGLHTTTPSSFLIQRLLKEMVKNSCKYAVIEVTSHAINQNRIWGCHFQIGVLTNITHEHLDYHKTFDSYLKTKASFLKKCAVAILNRDDPSFGLIRSLIHGKVVSYGFQKDADLVGEDLCLNGSNKQIFSTTYKLDNQNIKVKTETFLLGKYNVLNILAATGACLFLGLPLEKINEGIKTFIPVKGRLEVVIERPFKVIVDFAHTPNAFREILPTVRSLTQGRIIHVFGATGKRDQAKRPIMGEISGRIADLCVMTSEDTYGENPENIISQIEEGIKKTSKKERKTYWKIANRREAIEKALNLAKSGDIILLTGVGHQTSLNLGDRELPWNERNIVRELLKNMKLS